MVQGFSGDMMYEYTKIGRQGQTAVGLTAELVVLEVAGHIVINGNSAAFVVLFHAVQNIGLAEFVMLSEFGVGQFSTGALTIYEIYIDPEEVRNLPGRHNMFFLRRLSRPTSDIYQFSQHGLHFPDVRFHVFNPLFQCLRYHSASV